MKKAFYVVVCTWLFMLTVWLGVWLAIGTSIHPVLGVGITLVASFVMVLLMAALGAYLFGPIRK